MNRELKFRVWDLKNKFWIEPKHFQLDGKPLFTPNYYQEFEIQQFTGLYDKKGKPIYEGDIIQSTEGLGVIEYQEAAFILKNQDGGELFLYRSDCAVCYEIIGNVFENPDLLK